MKVRYYLFNSRYPDKSREEEITLGGLRNLLGHGSEWDRILEIGKLLPHSVEILKEIEIILD